MSSDSAATAAMICWARTSSGASGIVTRSSWPARMERTTAAASISSSPLVTTIRPFEVRESRWPARPTRCSAAATLRGDCTWTTRSMAPTSMPSSSEDVATSARSSPAFSRFSASSRARRESEPWWAATRPSGMRSLRSRAKRSAARRLWANTSVVRWAWTISAICCSVASHTVSLVAVRKSSTGATTCTSRSRAKPASMTIGSCAVDPVRNASASSTGRTVAEQPMRCGRAPGVCASTSACSRSSVRARCAPRLPAIIAWTSSTMTKRVCASAGRKPWLVSRM